jgi:hypothetical protein
MNPVSRLLGHFVDCRHATRMISQLQERPASGWEAVRLRWHLSVCAACTRFEKQVAFLREAMRRYRT